MYLHFVSMSRLHPSSINNFLRSSCSNIELSLSPMCPSISCIHCASYVDLFFIGLPTTSYVFIVSIPEFPRHQQLLACIWSQYLNSPHPVPGQKNVHGIQPNVSAYNNGVPLPPYGGKVQEAGARVQTRRRMARERRGAESSSAVSMATLYYKTIY